MRTWGAAGILGALVGAGLAVGGVWAQAPPTVIYATSFDPTNGFSLNRALTNQGGWIGLGSGGNGLVKDFFPGYDQQAYIGYFPPASGDEFLVTWRPLGYTVSAAQPIVKFSVMMWIVDSTNFYYDDFRWSIYNSAGDSLFAINFDNYTTNITYRLGNEPIYNETGFTFSNDGIYQLLVAMNFARNCWTAALNGQTIIESQPLSLSGQGLDLGDINAVWALWDPLYPGNNFMVFDEFQVVAESAWTPPLLAGPYTDDNGQPLLYLFGEPALRYALEASTDLKRWTALGTNYLSAFGALEWVDTRAATNPRQFYRARLVP